VSFSNRNEQDRHFTNPGGSITLRQAQAPAASLKCFTAAVARRGLQRQLLSVWEGL
jgi:hypothetical protein